VFALMKKILIFYNEPDILAYFSTVLEDNGFEVMTAESADEAQAHLEQVKPDLISLDIMMPKRSGIALYRELKLDDRYKDIPAIIISAFSMARDFDDRGFRKLIPEASVPEPLAFLEKPISPQTLVEAVNKIIGQE
jgi:two-component system, OmpR family, phosphate regulon response regulator PhoB